MGSRLQLAAATLNFCMYTMKIHTNSPKKSSPENLLVFLQVLHRILGMFSVLPIEKQSLEFVMSSLVEILRIIKFSLPAHPADTFGQL